MESDDEIRRVPEMGAEAAVTTASGQDGGSAVGPTQPSAGGSKRRGKSPADKENKRLKRYVEKARTILIQLYPAMSSLVRRYSLGPLKIRMSIL